MRPHLDEMYSPVIARMVRRAGIDITNSHESARDGIPDEDQLLLAAREGRCVVTENHGDFIRLTHEFYERGLPHAGVILVPSSVPQNAYAAIAAALVRLARERPEGLQP